jgi:ribonucleoside-diphosphate reductase alpha chain
VFELKGAEVPVGWSQLATDIAVSKYFRKAGLNGDKNSGERSVRQLVYRISHSLREAGDQFGGYFADKTAADNFEAELSHLLVTRRPPSTAPCGSTAASTSATASRVRAATGTGTPRPTR